MPMSHGQSRGVSAAVQEEIGRLVEETVAATPVTDVHTHLFPPSFGGMAASGADHVLTYHYLVSEVFRAAPQDYDAFWRTPRPQQADFIWNHLFRDRSPLSEATSGVVEIAAAFGVDLQNQGLDGLRQALSDTTTDAYAERVLDQAGVESVVMTNDPLDPVERQHWLQGAPVPSRFRAALRLDMLLNQWPEAVVRLRELGYRVSETRNGTTADGVRQYLRDWCARLQPVYLAASLPDTFRYPDHRPATFLLDQVILPHLAAEHRPLALMIGPRRGVNPNLRDGGDGVGPSSLEPLEQLLRHHPEVQFLASYLSRESQHALVVAARTFGNLMPFGCWWFLNTDSLVEEITRMRLELLGPTFIPQHSDARVLEHLIYKWARTRRVLTRVLTDHYARLAALGWTADATAVRRDVERLQRGNFAEVVAERH